MSAKALNVADMDGMIEPLKSLLDECETLEEYRDRLLDVYGDMDASPLGDLMQQAMTVADLAGRYDVRQR